MSFDSQLRSRRASRARNTGTVACGLIIAIAVSAPFAPGDEVWGRSRMFTNPAGAADDRFGGAVALAGELAIVASPGDDERGADAGAIYLFDRSSGDLRFKISSSDVRAGDAFGGSVSMNSLYILVGAAFDDDRGLDSGAAFVFDPATGTQLRKITAPDGGFMDQFGWSVAVDGANAVIGAIGDDVGATDSGSASLFNLSSGARTAKFVATGSQAGDLLGYAVAISGANAVAGAPFHDSIATDDGVAYVFDSTTGALRIELASELGRENAQLGYAVAIEADLAVVGAPGGGEAAEGAAFVFDVLTGDVRWRLLPTGALPGDAFGAAVAIAEEVAAVGAPHGAGVMAGTGIVRLFDLRTGAQIAEIRDPDGQTGDMFGEAVGFRVGSMLAGSPGADRGGVDVGLASLYRERDAFSIEPNPLVGGEAATFYLYDLKPLERTWMLYSTTGLGRGVYLRQLGVVVDLEDPAVAWGPLRTDAGGSIEVTGTVPFSQRPINLWFQGVQNRNITDVIATQVAP